MDLLGLGYWHLEWVLVEDALGKMVLLLGVQVVSRSQISLGAPRADCQWYITASRLMKKDSLAIVVALRVIQC